jgi:two-component system, chemotaxis family, CheB/CheR fusion protein
VTSPFIRRLFGVPRNGERRQQLSALPPSESKVAASFAHDINNPLQSLINLLHLIETETILTADSRRYIALAREEARRISHITHAAMDGFGNAEGPEDANVPEILDSVLQFYTSRFEFLRIVVSDHYCCPDGNLLVYPNALRQMFSNLLLNAVDAMPNGGKICTKISSAQEWTGRQRRGLRITVGDNGCGIATDDLQKILEPFFTTKGASGNGIGLSLVKDTVRSHDGVLRVRSSTKPGRTGSVFSIFLPAAESMQTAGHSRAA